MYNVSGFMLKFSNFVILSYRRYQCVLSYMPVHTNNSMAIIIIITSDRLCVREFMENRHNIALNCRKEDLWGGKWLAESHTSDCELRHSDTIFVCHDI